MVQIAVMLIRLCNEYMVQASVKLTQRDMVQLSVTTLPRYGADIGKISLDVARQAVSYGAGFGKVRCNNR